MESAKDNSKKEKQEPKASDKVVDPPTDAPKADVPSTSVGGKTCNSFTIPFKSKIIGAKRRISDLQVNISVSFIYL